MNPDLDTLAAELYVRIDDLLAQNPHWAPQRPAVGIAAKLSDAELVTLAVISALLGHDNESKFVRYAHEHLRRWFPYLPNRAGCNKRLRRSGQMIAHVMGALWRECTSWHDDVRLVDSAPVECGRSRETQKRSDLAGWAQYGFRASHSRYFWGLRLHLVTTPSGLAVMFALAGAKADEREVCGRCARSSNRSTRPSKARSASNATAAEPKPAPPYASSHDSWPSPQPSGTTKPTATHAPAAHSPPTTTNPLELTI